MKSKVTLWNMITGLLLQLCTLISGFIVPRIILSYFGAEVHGLVSSLSQFLSYIALIEGGITGVITANLYRPLVNKDNLAISSIVKTSSSFFKRIGLLFAIYAIVLGALYPVLFNTHFSWLYVFSLTLVMSLNLLIQYMFSLSIKTLLHADKKGYIINLTQIIIVILNVVLSLISVTLFPSIHILKLISGLVYIVQPFIYMFFVKKYYALNYDVKADNSLIKQRWNGFSINLASFIHNSTDVTVLTIFTDLNTVSIYSVHALVSGGVRSLINASLSGVSQTIGHAYAKKDFEHLNFMLDVYEYLVFILICLIMGTTILLITPFVALYTNGITYVNYYQPLFGILLVVSEALYIVKYPHLSLAYAANRFKETTIPAYLEAAINVLVSIVAVNWFGLVGVAIGTISGMVYRMIFHVWLTSKIIPERKQTIFYSKLIIFFLTTGAGILICNSFGFRITSPLEWVFSALVYVGIIGTLLAITSFLFFKKEIRYLFKYVKTKRS